MTAVLLDTHAWAWSLTADAQLSSEAIRAISVADTVLVSPISFFEIGQKVRIGRWPEMKPFMSELGQLLEQQGGVIAGLTPEICLQAALMRWEHRDPFDRLLAATALNSSVSLISADMMFDTLPGLTRVW